ncbi:MAG TPA: hypothetical protein P5239_09370, partial [Victivallales bacterium]|nr:hypothetical protein [Victivallales bacterium]
MKIKVKIEFKVILTSIFWGFLLGSLILEADYLASKYLMEKEPIISFANGDLITRIIIYFLSMSFILLLRILYDTENILKYKSVKDTEDLIDLFA